MKLSMAVTGCSSLKAQRLTKTIQAYTLLAPVLILVFIFCYIPMYGIIIGFQDYYPGAPMFGPGVKWVGLQYITRFVRSEYFGRLIRNSLYLSLLNLIFGFTAPIIFALLLDQIRAQNYRKIVQTASYLPYFISTVIVAGMVILFVGPNGIITTVMSALGVKDTNFLINREAFPIIYTATNVWKGFGFGSILYLSTITSIDPGLYESAKIDGANRFQQVLHITLPGIQRIIAINLIMTLGGVLSANSELILLLYHPSTYETADVIGTYTYRLGIQGGEFSYTTAVGFFMSIIAFALTYAANKVSNKLTDYGLW